MPPKVICRSHPTAWRGNPDDDVNHYHCDEILVLMDVTHKGTAQKPYGKPPAPNTPRSKIHFAWCPSRDRTHPALARRICLTKDAAMGASWLLTDAACAMRHSGSVP